MLQPVKSELFRWILSLTGKLRLKILPDERCDGAARAGLFFFDGFT